MAVITAASDPQPSGAPRPPPEDEGVVRERGGEDGEACEVLARAVRADEVGGDHHGQWGRCHCEGIRTRRGRGRRSCSWS